MADEENNQPKKSRGILKILMFVFGALILVGAGLGAGFLMFGSTNPDPSEEIEQIIERKMIEAEEEKAAHDLALFMGEHERVILAAAENMVAGKKDPMAPLAKFLNFPLVAPH